MTMGTCEIKQAGGPCRSSSASQSTTLKDHSILMGAGQALYTPMIITMVSCAAEADCSTDLGDIGL